MPKKTIFLLGCFFVFGGFFLTLRYINLIQEKKKVESQLKEVKIQVGFLEGNLRQETELRQKLDEDKSVLSDGLKETREANLNLNTKNDQLQEHIFSLVKEIESMENHNSRVKEELAQTQEKLDALLGKNIELEARLNSVSELKKAIAELKLKLKTKKSGYNYKLKPMRFKEEKQSWDEEGINGNSGFIIKNGVPTYKGRVKIEVKPLL